MLEYRRPIAPGATFFFTVVTNFRRPILTGPAASGFLRTAFREEPAHHPFEIDAIVILPCAGINRRGVVNERAIR